MVCCLRLGQTENALEANFKPHACNHQRNLRGRKMKIAQVSPLAEPVPPIGYGGTERIVAYLSAELIRRGHAVTLFASGDSTTNGTLLAGPPRALASRVGPA